MMPFNRPRIETDRQSARRALPFSGPPNASQ